MRKGDLFIYRRPQKVSEIPGQFHLFGAGKVGEIARLEGTRVLAALTKPVMFSDRILQRDLETFPWSFKKREKPTWEHFFNQYGMNQIHQADFLNLLALARVGEPVLEPEEISLVDTLQQQQSAGGYSVEDQMGMAKTRGAAQKVFADQVKANYGYTCAITGIRTNGFLVASHIVPWSFKKEHRLDPQNGICLSTLVDKAFDKGYLTVDARGKVRVSAETKTDAALHDLLTPYCGMKVQFPKGHEPRAEFLKWHHDNVFKG